MALQQNLRKQFSLIIRPSAVQCFATTSVVQKQPKRPAVARKLDSVGASLASKGFLRPNKSYEPPENVADKIRTICSSLQIPASTGHQLKDVNQKFKLLALCFENFRHSVPSSQVHEIQTIENVIRFYETPVDATVPYEALKKIDLPENLHIQYEYLRFNPDTDTKFNGQTAFPKSSTLVTGLKYRGKYVGHSAKRSWP